MATFLITLLVVQLAGIGARDQMLVAHLAARTGQRLSLWATASGAAALATLAAAWAGARSASEFDPAYAMLLVAMALGLAALESLFVRPPRMAAEPTHSLGAAAIVMLAHQVTDAARLTIFALALGKGFAPACAGGIVASAANLFLGWAGADHLAGGRPPAALGAPRLRGAAGRAGGRVRVAGDGRR